MPPNATKQQTFHQFSELPTELQLKIWQEAISSIPLRIVEVPNLQARRYSTTQTIPPLTSACAIPAVLHASRDSRFLALQRWRLAFRFPPYDQTPRIFFDFERDVFWHDRQIFYSLPTFEQLDSAELHAVRRIAINISEWWDTDFDGGRSLAEHIHKAFPGVEEVIVVGSQLSREGWERDPKRIQISPEGWMDPQRKQIRLVGYKKGNGEGHKYEQKALVEAFVRRYMENGWTWPTLAYGDYVRFEKGDEWGLPQCCE